MGNMAKPQEAIEKVLAGKYLIFDIGTNLFGLSISIVQEIIGLVPLQKGNPSKDGLRGITHLRGSLLPLVDLDIKLGIRPCEDSNRMCTMVLHMAGTYGDFFLGLVVDNVLEVITLEEDEVTIQEDFSAPIAFSKYLGTCEVGERTAYLLDVKEIFSDEDIESLWKQVQDFDDDGKVGGL